MLNTYMDLLKILHKKFAKLQMPKAWTNQSPTLFMSRFINQNPSQLMYLKLTEKEQDVIPNYYNPLNTKKERESWV